MQKKKKVPYQNYVFYQIIQSINREYFPRLPDYARTYKWYQRFRTSFLNYLKTHSLSQDLTTDNAKRFLCYILYVYLYTYDYSLSESSISKKRFSKGYSKFLNNCLKNCITQNAKGHIYKRTIISDDMSFFLSFFTNPNILIRKKEYILTDTQRTEIEIILQSTTNTSEIIFQKLVSLFFEKN